jgi:hypothetical protein
LDKQENRHGKDRKECRRRQVQLHQGRLPLQPLHLQELQLLNRMRRRPGRPGGGTS